jgi:hypothetical protein
MRYFIAKFKNLPGRYFAVETGGGFEARKIHNAKRQWERYHNRPDEFTGLALNEMTYYFSHSDVVSLKPFTPPGLAS